MSSSMPRAAATRSSSRGVGRSHVGSYTSATGSESGRSRRLPPAVPSRLASRSASPRGPGAPSRSRSTSSPCCSIASSTSPPTAKSSSGIGEEVGLDPGGVVAQRRGCLLPRCHQCGPAANGSSTAATCAGRSSSSESAIPVASRTRPLAQTPGNLWLQALPGLVEEAGGLLQHCRRLLGPFGRRGRSPGSDTA